jgi:vacuolar-type H+-ATPase subunit I/STV1
MIAKMDRVEIVCVKDLLSELAAFIQAQGVMHMEEVPLVLEDDPDFLHRTHIPEDEREEFELLESFRRTIAEVLPLLTAKPAHSAVSAATHKLANQDDEEWRSLARTISRELRRSGAATREHSRQSRSAAEFQAEPRNGAAFDVGKRAIGQRRPGVRDQRRRHARAGAA